jgi:fructuronate reductase
MKLRLLNGSHSTLAYLGYLAGHATIAQAAGDPALGRLVERLMAEEIAPTLANPPGVDLARYRATLIERFRNPALPHRTAQVAMDGSQKLPQRLLGTIRDRLAGGGPVRHLALAVAGWMRYAAGFDEHGGKIEVNDPMAARLAVAAASAHGDPARLARAFLAIREIFGEDLAARPSFVDEVSRQLAALVERGSRATVEAHLAAA